MDFLLSSVDSDKYYFYVHCSTTLSATSVSANCLSLKSPLSPLIFSKLSISDVLLWQDCGSLPPFGRRRIFEGYPKRSVVWKYVCCVLSCPTHQRTSSVKILDRNQTSRVAVGHRLPNQNALAEMTMDDSS